MSNAISPGLQMRECMKTKTCPKWSMEDPACFDHFNCTTLFRQVDCVVVCSDRTVGEFICYIGILTLYHSLIAKMKHF